jgi:hypothetical protein
MPRGLAGSFVLLNYGFRPFFIPIFFIEGEWTDDDGS